MKHLPYGGSTASRTLNCPGWLKKSENITRRPAGQAAMDGSMHHEVMELCQKTDTVPKDHIGYVYEEDGNTREFTEDDLTLSEIAYNATNTLLDELDIDIIMVEPFVELVPDVAGGSIDLLGLSADGTTLLILDYKFGSYKVQPEESAQGGVYGISAMADKTTADMFAKVDEVVFAIVQPKVKGVVFTWETDIKWLKGFEKKFRAAMKATQLNPGSHCKYCPAEPYCEAKRTGVMAAALLNPKATKDLQAAADVVEEVENWVKAVHEELYMQLNRGVPLQGWKVVEKRHTRKWVDDDAVYPALKTYLPKADCFKTTILTPPQLEKVLKKVEGCTFDLNGLIVSSSSGTTLAKADDSREAVVVSDVQGHLADMMK